MTAQEPVSRLRTLRRTGGSARGGGCGSRCRQSQIWILPICSPALTRRSAMSPPDEIRRIIDSAEPVLPRLRALSAAEFLRLELPPRGMVLEPILPEKGLALLHAYRGIGKTHLALGIGFAIASRAELL